MKPILTLRIKPLFGLIFIVSLLQNQLPAQGQTYTFNHNFLAMGTQVSIMISSENRDGEKNLFEKAEAEFKRIENLISSWKKASQTSLINKNAGIRPVKVDKELFELIRESKRISKLTKGRFDISFASINEVWRFDGSMTSLPTKKAIRNSVSKINHKHIILNEKDTTVFLKKRGMKIGFGAIGKGYAVDKTKSLLQELGIKRGLINAGGDLIVWDYSSDSADWNIGIFKPGAKNELLGKIKIMNGAIVTSGNAFKYVIIDEKRYAHIINPKTGWPSQGLKTVTILAENTTIADAFATAIFVYGKRKGLRLIEKLKEIEGILITDRNEVASSSGFPKFR